MHDLSCWALLKYLSIIWICSSNLFIISICRQHPQIFGGGKWSHAFFSVSIQRLQLWGHTLHSLKIVKKKSHYFHANLVIKNFNRIPMPPIIIKTKKLASLAFLQYENFSTLCDVSYLGPHISAKIDFDTRCEMQGKIMTGQPLPIWFDWCLTQH